MIGFYKNSLLTRAAWGEFPKWFLIPQTGGAVESSLWIADNYAATVTTAADIGATTLLLSDTFEFPEAGQVRIGAEVYAYTAKTSTSLTGVSPLTAAAPVGTVVRPTTGFSGALAVSPSGSDLEGTVLPLKVSLKRAGQTSWGLPNVPLIISATDYFPGSPPVEIRVKVECSPGVRREFRNLRLLAIGASGQIPTGPLAVFRGDQGAKLHTRLLPSSRQVPENLPGFVLGDHRWRDKDTSNKVVIVPTSWNVNHDQIGADKFVPGVGHGNDLQVVGLEKQGSAVRARIRPGCYFTGLRGYYLPAESILEFLPASGALSWTLAAPPKAQSPIFVGQWKLDAQGYYEKINTYRYVGRSFSSTLDFDPDDPGLQFTFDRASRKLTINRAPDNPILFLGVAPTGASVKFDLPVHPVSFVRRVWAENPTEALGPFDHDRGQGTLVVTLPAGNSAAGRPLYAEVDSALAVLVDGGASDTRLLDLNLNPAFAGISHGYIHLQHRKWKPRSLELFADKPRISLPPSAASTPNMTAFGPVYYQNDYALLLVRATGASAEDRVPNIRLRVEVDAGFQGLINYQDPAAELVEVVTGGDGSASLIFTPSSGYGMWIPTNRVSGNTVTLPDAGIPISQLWSSADGYKVLLYAVQNDDPWLGKVGADVTLGETPWIVSGGGPEGTYRTNGRRVLLKEAGNFMQPTHIRDVAGRSHTNPLFDGVARSIEYASLPAVTNTGAWFVSFMGRCTIRLISDEFGIQSNSILLQLAPPGEIVEFSPEGTPVVQTTPGYLILDNASQGRLNANRLAGGPIPSNTQNTRRL